MATSDLAAWWWRPAAAFTNFGDELTAVILGELGYTVRRVLLRDADIALGGSVLHHLEDTRTRPGLAVFGCGFIDASSGASGDYRWLLARGPATRDLAGVDCPVGDPALLASRVWPDVDTRYRYGWVPHYVDDRDPPADADVTVDVRDHAANVARTIGACEHVTTSSLHAAVVATAYGRTVTVDHHPDVKGDGFKFYDFAASLEDSTVDDLQQTILAALP